MQHSDCLRGSSFGELSDGSAHDPQAPGVAATPLPGAQAQRRNASACEIVRAHSNDSQGACNDNWNLLGGGALVVGLEADQLFAGPSSVLDTGFCPSQGQYVDNSMLGIQSEPTVYAEWDLVMLNDNWAKEEQAGFDGTSGAGVTNTAFPYSTDNEMRAEDLRPRTSERKKRSSQRSDTLANKLKNREAQRRFRDRQRGKLTALEDELSEMREFRTQALANEQQLRADRAALSQQIIGLQAQLSGLHARELAIAELAGDIAALRAGSEAGSEAAQDELAEQLGELQKNDGTESCASFCAAKLCLFIKPEDLSATDPALVLALAGAQDSTAAAVSPGQLKLRLRADGGERVYSLAQLMHLPPQTFVAMYDRYVAALLALEDATAPDAAPLASQLRALLCCFAAVHPQAAQSCCRVLKGCRAAEHDAAAARRRRPAVRLDAANKELLDRLANELRLSAGQLQRMRQAALTHARQQAQLEGERSALLRGVAVPLGCLAGAGPSHVASALGAGASLRRNLDLDVFNACRLSAHFLTEVLTTQQFVQLLAASHPHPPNLVELVHFLDTKSSFTDA